METHILSMENILQAIAQWLVENEKTEIIHGTINLTPSPTSNNFIVTITSDTTIN